MSLLAGLEFVGLCPRKPSTPLVLPDSRRSGTEPRTATCQGRWPCKLSCPLGHLLLATPLRFAHQANRPLAGVLQVADWPATRQGERAGDGVALGRTGHGTCPLCKTTLQAKTAEAPRSSTSLAAQRHFVIMKLSSQGCFHEITNAVGWLSKFLRFLVGRQAVPEISRGMSRQGKTTTEPALAGVVVVVKKARRP